MGAGVASVLDADGWFHTGDLGERDASGNLYFKGRQKNVIVTPEGLNVYPADLEAELRKEPGVRDCVVVGLARDGNAEPCAVLLLRDSHGEAAAGEIVERANRRLAPFQQMRRWLVWRDSDFPRTPTQKPMLSRIREAAEAELGGAQPATAGVPTGPLAELYARVSHGRSLPDDATALELSSVERVELLSALEDRYQVDLSETEFASADSVRELERLVDSPSSRAAPFHYPLWPQGWPARVFRFAVLNLVARPAMLILAWPKIRGRQNLRGVSGPVLVVSNHVTYLDPGYVLEALPGRLRRRLAVAMDGEVLARMRNPAPGTGLFSGVLDRVKYILITSIFNVFPLPRVSGFRKSFAFVGDLIDRGWSVLVFPEGELTRDGRIAPFRAGVGLLAARLKVPVVPLRLDGLFERKETGKSWARPGQIRVSIGAPVRFAETDAAEQIARDLEAHVRALGAVR
jgi:long-chain acyl-CoA synthetase